MPENVGFTVADLIVISILWCYELINYWLLGLSKYTSQVLFPNNEFHSMYFRTHETWLFFTKCFTIVVFALLVDAYDHKFAIAFAVLCMCLCIPIIGVVVCIAKIAPAAILLFWTVSAIYVISPASYCLIFNQNLVPVRRTVHRLVALFECIETLIGKYLIFLCIPDTASGTDEEYYVLIVDWVIFTPLLITLITLVNRVKNFVAGDFIREKGIQRILHGIRNDVRVQPPRREGKSSIHVIFFVLLLAPALTLSVLDVALSNINSDDDARAQSPSLKHIMYTAQLMTIPCMELIFSLVPMIKETTREMLSLGMAHFANIAVLTLLILRMDHAPERSGSLSSNFRVKRDVVEQLRSICYVNCEIPPPRPGFASFAMVNTAPQTALLEDEPSVLFKKRRGLLVNYLQGSVELPRNQTAQTIELTATLHPESRPSVKKNITLFEKKHYFYIISGNSTDIKCIEVEGTGNVPRMEAPQLTFLNSFAEEMIDGIPVLSYHEYRINSTENKFEELYPFPEVGQYDVVELPVGSVQIAIAYLGTNERLAQILGTDAVTVTTEPFDMFLAYVSRKKKQYVHLLKTKKTQNVVTTTMRVLPEHIQEPDHIQKSSYALLGATLGIASVGYTHFLWIESPVRLRAVIFALLRASTSLVGWMTYRVVGETFTRPKAIALLLLQVVTTVWHLGLSWIFETRIREES